MNKFLNNKKIFLLFIIILIIAIIIISKHEIFKNENLIKEDIFVEEDNKNSSIEKQNIKVHIIGEINKSGLYELDEGSRVYDLILLAGGETENANLNKINLAYELSDGEQVYIPSIFDENNEYSDNKISSSSGKININKATLEDLQTISGVGPSLAQKIISYRTSNGKFSSLEELKNVSGIGDKKFESIKEYLTLK